MWHSHISELHLGRCFCALSDLTESEEADRKWATWLTPISMSTVGKSSLVDTVWLLSDLF